MIYVLNIIHKGEIVTVSQGNAPMVVPRVGDYVRNSKMPPTMELLVMKVVWEYHDNTTVANVYTKVQW
jgi:hypothetical protein